MLSLLTALFIAAHPLLPDAVPDPISAAVNGLVAVVEEDGQPDVRLEGMRTDACRTVVMAAGRQWTIDWHRVEAVALEEGFVFVAAPPVRIAIVADGLQPDQAERLRLLDSAMRQVAQRCAGTRR